MCLTYVHQRRCSCILGSSKSRYVPLVFVACLKFSVSFAPAELRCHVLETFGLQWLWWNLPRRCQLGNGDFVLAKPTHQILIVLIHFSSSITYSIVQLICKPLQCVLNVTLPYQFCTWHAFRFSFNEALELPRSIEVSIGLQPSMVRQ